MVTEFLLLFPKAQVVRGYNVDKRIRPDAEIAIGDLRFLLELDTGKMTHRQLRFKWLKRYAGVTDYMLFVTLGSSDRLDRVIRNAKRVHDIALFATFSEVMQCPYGKVWTDAKGKQVALPYRSS
jgi:hypothetical protein